MNGKINFDELYSLALRLAAEPRKKTKNFTAENIYVDLVLTSAISEIQAQLDFVLKGGTGIIKTWATPYRFSYDLDFSYYASSSHPRRHYKDYKQELQKLVGNLGFHLSDEEGESHREGGRIYILKMMDDAEHLKMPIKLSVSSIDKSPCFEPEMKRFNPVVETDKRMFKTLYPDMMPRLSNVNVRVLCIEELCAEKIRALATRGPQGEWSLLLRDVVDLYVMNERGVLDRVLEKHQDCIRKKFENIKGRSYWKKFEDFMAKEPEVRIREEDLSIFFDPTIISEQKASRIISKTRENLDRILKL